jgi:hypothetical protein
MSLLDLLTVVIPSVGEKSLISTLHSLTSSADHPFRILVVFPPSCNLHPSLHAFLNYSYVRFLFSSREGQVSQRSFGFSCSSTPFTLQLDSDLLISCNDILKMLQLLVTLPPHSALSPTYILYKSLSAYYSRSKVHNSPGVISNDGFASPLFSNDTSARYFESQWLPGGCVLHKTSDLILDNYFPFKGKAYCEDLIHSHYLLRSGIRLYIDNHSFCYLDSSPLPVNLISFYNETRARLFYLKLLEPQPLYFFIVLCILRSVRSYFCRLYRSLCL